MVTSARITMLVRKHGWAAQWKDGMAYLSPEAAGRLLVMEEEGPPAPIVEGEMVHLAASVLTPEDAWEPNLWLVVRVGDEDAEGLRSAQLMAWHTRGMRVPRVDTYPYEWLERTWLGRAEA